MLGQRVAGLLLVAKKVLEKLQRALNSLRGVLDQDIECRLSRMNVPHQRFDRWDVQQIQPIDTQPLAPICEIGLAGVAQRRIAWEPRRHYHPRAVAEQAQRGLVADLDAPAGDKRDTTREISALEPLSIVERRA